VPVQVGSGAVHDDKALVTAASRAPGMSPAAGHAAATRSAGRAGRRRLDLDAVEDDQSPAGCQRADQPTA
jgi:hypothetical protein